MREITIAEVVAALRSGDYRQTKGKLRTVSQRRFCCLGVAEDLAGAKWSTDDTGTACDEYEGTVMTPHAARQHLGEWGDFLGWPSSMEDPKGEDVAHRLASLNDKGTTFAEIADWIEQRIAL